MSELLLFKIEPEKILLFKIEPEKILFRCKQCRYIYNHQYGNMKYCSRKRQKNTAYGNKKVKSNDKACEFFVAKIEN